MPVVQIPPLVVLLPIFVLGALSGFKRGWRDEAWTLGALVLTVFVVARPDRRERMRNAQCGMRNR